MHIVELLLPLKRANGTRIPRNLFQAIVAELKERHGGLTAHTRAPATGLWEAPDGRTDLDDIIIIEVMVDALDEEWWNKYRSDLETRLEQEEVVVRAHVIRRL